MNKVLIICGPTATGKTALGLDLAQKFNGEVLSADSRMVYKGMDIITGKDLPEFSIFQFPISNLGVGCWVTKNGARIWLTDLVEPNQEFSVADWRKAAIDVISNIWKENKLPIVVGGTGLYIKSLLEDIETIDIPPDLKLRDKLKDKSSHELYEMLSDLDKDKAESMNNSDKQNPRRLVRAIEIVKQKTKSIKQKFNADFLIIGLNAEKDILEDRIKKRVDERMENGALQEIEELIVKGIGWNRQSMTAIGYRQLRIYFEKEVSLEDAVEQWKHEEIQYVKKQITWFKKVKNINWFNTRDLDFKLKVEKLVQNWYN